MRERAVDGSVRAASKGGDLTFGMCLAFDAGAGWCQARQFHLPETLPACDRVDRRVRYVSRRRDDRAETCIPP